MLQLIAIFLLAIPLLAQNQTITSANIWGGSATPDSTNKNGAYYRWVMIPYNPYDSGSQCIDYGGNVVSQPIPPQGAPSAGANDVFLWNGASPLMPFTGGVGLVTPVIYDTAGAPGPCGSPFAVNIQGVGLNTNAYFFPRGGLGTDNGFYNAIQALQGGVLGNDFLAGVLYPTGTTVCANLACSSTTTLSSPAYLGGHVDIGHSIGPPATATITSNVTAGVSTSLQVSYALGLFPGTQITFEDSSPEVVTVASSYIPGTQYAQASLTIPLVSAVVNSHSAGTYVAWGAFSGSISKVTNPFSGEEGLVQGQMYFDDTLNCYRGWYGVANGGFKCIDAGGGGSPGGVSADVQFNNGGVFGGDQYFRYTDISTVSTLFVGINPSSMIESATSGIQTPVFSSANVWSSGSTPPNAFVAGGGTATMNAGGDGAFQDVSATTVINGKADQCTGTVNTSGTAVTLASGCTFNQYFDGGQIVINSVNYTVASGGVTSPSTLTLTASAGTQTGVSYAMHLNSFQNGSGSYFVDWTGKIAGVSLAIGSGSPFTVSSAGNTVLNNLTINGTCNICGAPTWPTSGDVVVSNGTNSPAGIAPINGDCITGVGGSWVAGSCSGSGTAVTSVTGTPSNGITASPTTGAVIINLSQNLSTSGSPVFAGIDVTGSATLSGGVAFSTSTLTGSHVQNLGTTDSPSFYNPTFSFFDVSNTATFGGSLTGTHAQNLGTGDSPQFNGFTITGSGTNTIAGTLQVSPATSSTGTLSIGTNNGSSATGGHGFSANNTTGTVSMIGYDSSGLCEIGSTFAGGIACASDARLKKNVVTITSALPVLMMLRPVTYDWLKSPSHSVGFIAQEVRKVLPDLVQENETTDPLIKDGKVLTLSQQGLIPYLVKAIQEQQEEIEALQFKLSGQAVLTK